jgi:ATPase subunit of ABC transporter with duplicated ATPase domains
MHEKEIEKLQAEKEKVERQLAQEQHKIQRLENRAAYYEKGDRRKRAHRLITRGAAIESVAPQTKELSETEFYAFAEQTLALPDAQRLLTEAVSRHAGGD